MAKSNAKSITLTVRGDSRTLTVAERFAAMQARNGVAGNAVQYVWPVPEACYLPKSEESTAIRTRNYFDAVQESDNMVDSILAGMVKHGATLTIVVEAGARMSTDKDAGEYANVINGEALHGLSTLPGVTVECDPTSDDPREFVSED